MEKSMNEPAGSGSHTHSKETVIIQQQQEKQQRQDHTLINKLKEKVNQMEVRVREERSDKVLRIFVGHDDNITNDSSL